MVDRNYGGSDAVSVPGCAERCYGGPEEGCFEINKKQEREAGRPVLLLRKGRRGIA